MPNNKQLKAEVLEHWNRMLELSVNDIRAGKEGPNVQNCAFCGEYFTTFLCVGCPVRIKTGEPGCRNTPYTLAARLYLRISEHRGGRLSEFRKAVKAEIDFLEKLEV